MMEHARLQDYLDDKLQSAADLGTLDSLLRNVKEQQELLKKQLVDAQRDHRDAERQAQTHTDAVRTKVQVFQQEQSDIDRRLLDVTESESSDEAVLKFEKSMARLKKMDLAGSYVELLRYVQTLRSDCLGHLGKSDEAAMEPYRKLQRLVISLHPLQEAAEGAAPHVVDFSVQQALSLRKTIEKSFAEDLEKTLQKMNWPKVAETVPLALEKEWTKNVQRLLDLQRPDLEAQEHHSARPTTSRDPLVLLPLAVMVQSLEQRFAYHFSGNKPTNRLDKPEFFLNHVTDLISNYSDFIQNALQPILVHVFRGSDMAFTPAYIDANSAFITALLPMLQRKLSIVAGQVADQPQLLSHLVHEVLVFDTRMQDSYSYTPLSPAVLWRGLGYFLLDTCGYLQPWLSVERDFALARYHSINDASDAKDLDYDSVPSDATKPTKAAIRVNDLLETVTELYKPLASFGQKLRFLIDIQIEIFDQFHQRLNSSLEAYLSMTTTVGRTMHGVSREKQSELQGVKGLDHLCRVFGSAEYLERAMRDWSDDIFFLDLWEELQERTRNIGEGNISKNLGGLQEIQQKTSSAVGGVDDEMQGGLFDETASAYHRLRVRSEAAIVETVTYNIREALKPYRSVSTWASLSFSSAGAAVSSELDTIIRLISEYFGFLGRAVGRAPLRRMGSVVCQAMQSYIWDNVLTRQTFSTAGARQLEADVQGLCSHMDRYISSGHAAGSMRKLLEGVTLLNLPVRGEIPREQPGRSGEEDDGAAWEDSNDQMSDTDQKMSLFEAERLVFMNNENARHALDQLGLDLLSESDARSVLERRVELGS